jgi:hypothetical protein
MEESQSVLRAETTPTSPSKCPERLVDDTRTSVRGNGVWLDNTAAVNEELMAVIPNKIFKMRTLFELDTDFNFEGQVGFICLKKNEQNEPVSCVAVSALHNIAEVKDKPAAKFVRSTALAPDCSFGLPFPEAGMRFVDMTPYELSPCQELSIPWKHGIDIAWSSKVVTTVGIVEHSFERVHPGFEYKVGQKVGIGIYSDTGATGTTVGDPNVTKEELARIYGPPKKRHIYTGKITMVGAHHIEYDINSFEGCSGAVVFLLGVETQPSDSGVTRDDAGKAIAVHAGAHPRKIKNIGFKLTAKPLTNKSQ